MKKGKSHNILGANIPKRVDEKAKEKKKRKGQNSVELTPIIEVVRRK